MKGYIEQRAEAEGVDLEEAEFRTWIDIHGERLGHDVAVREAKRLCEAGYFKPKRSEP